MMKREMRNMATKQELAESHSDVRLLTVNRGILDVCTDDHDYSANKDTHTSSPAVTDQADGWRSDNTAEREDG